LLQSSDSSAALRLTEMLAMLLEALGELRGWSSPFSCSRSSKKKDCQEERRATAQSKEVSAEPRATYSLVPGVLSGIQDGDKLMRERKESER
jgi:hypothetical protein